MRNIVCIAICVFAFSSAAAAQNDAPVASPAVRIAGRTFPSVFMAWSPADNLKGEDPHTTLCRHDLVFSSPEFYGLKFVGQYRQLATEFAPQSVAAALALRKQLLEKNPNLLMLAELRYHDVAGNHLPDDSTWFVRKNGERVAKNSEGKYFLLDESNSDMQAQVARQAKAVMDSGALDGVMLDWWEDDRAHLNLVRKVRAAVGDKGLIIVNTNDRQTPLTAAYINGYFMECYRSQTALDWKRIADTLEFGERNLKRPHIDCLETWYHNSRQDLNLMRATTTLSLTLSDGYCLFSDPNPLPTPDHLHDWYDYWNRSLGKPTGRGTHAADGSCRREFDHGMVVYNPLGNKPVVVKFASLRERLSTREIGTEFTVPPEDGDIFLVP